MPIERRRRGSGITAKEETRITGPFGAAEHVELRRMIDRDFSFEGLIGGPLEAQMSRILEAAGITADLEPFIEELRKSLEAAGVEKSQVDAAAASYVKLADECKAPNWATIVQLRGFADDSEQDFAARLLDKLGLVRAMIDRNESELAARFACELGVLWTQAVMKFRWEPDVFHGQKWAKNQAEGMRELQRLNSQRAEAAATDRAILQKMADDLWKLDPTFRKIAVARVIVKKLGYGKVHTVRRQIHRPSKS